MSWFRYWWRTQQTAISEMSCRIQWIIKCSNANGTLGWPLGVCLFEYQFSLLTTFRCFTSRLFFWRLLVECEQENCLIASKPDQTSLWVTRTTPLFLGPVLYCLKRMMLHSCVCSMVAKGPRRKSSTWCVSVTRQCIHVWPSRCNLQTFVTVIWVRVKYYTCKPV